MKTKQQPTRFTKALNQIFYDRGWNLPAPYVIEVYEQHIRRLEARIDELSGSTATRRIDPIKEKDNNHAKLQRLNAQR